MNGNRIENNFEFQSVVTNGNQILNLFFKDALNCFSLLDREFNFIRVNDAYAASVDKSLDFLSAETISTCIPLQ